MIRKSMLVGGLVTAIALGGGIGAYVSDAIGNEDDTASGIGMPVNGDRGVPETLVNDDAYGQSLGMPVPGYEDEIEDTEVEVDGSLGMVVPGFEGTVSDTTVEVVQ